MPERIQRQRTKGWRMPDTAVYVGRPTKWGNPYSLRPGEGGEPTGTRAMLVDEFRYWLAHRHDRYSRPGVFTAPGFATCGESREARDLLLSSLPELAGHDLACWCPVSQPCHADVLLELANKAEG